MLSTDITIIGAGPVGLFAVFECGMLGLDCHVIDSLPQIGGQCSALYPEKPIYDIPAFPSISGGDLIDRLEEQAAPFNPTYHLGHIMQSVKNVDGGFHLTTDQGLKIDCGAIIIAAGPGAFEPNRPPLENIENYEGKSIFYAVRKKEDFTGKIITIAGGGDSAVDWAVALSDVAKHVHVVHRRDQFRAAPQSVKALHDLAAQDKVTLHIPHQLKSLSGDDGQLHHITIVNNDSQTIKIKSDILLPFFGLKQSLGPLAGWGYAIQHNDILVDPATAQTSTPGIYAIGDVASYDHKHKLILCGFAEAAAAAHHARSYLNPHQDFHFEYSTSKGIPR